MAEEELAVDIAKNMWRRDNFENGLVVLGSASRTDYSIRVVTIVVGRGDERALKTTVYFQAGLSVKQMETCVCERFQRIYPTLEGALEGEA